MGNKGIRVNNTGTKVDWMAPRDNWQDVARGYINRYRGGESEESPPVVVPTTPEPAGPTLAEIREALAAKAREKAQAAIGTPVTCWPLADISRGTAAQYLAMQIGWPIGLRDVVDANGMGVEDRSVNRISSRFGASHSSGLHLGTDLIHPDARGCGLSVGLPLLAVTDGEVVYDSRISDSTTGFAIMIQSDLNDPATGEKLIFNYQHLQFVPKFRRHRFVKRGQIIGYLGATGRGITGAHLHFEVSNSGGVWTPNPESADPSTPLRRWTRISRRVNPVFFYPAGSFQGDTDIWNEVRGSQPRS